MTAGQPGDPGAGAARAPRIFLLSPANCSGRRGTLLRTHAARGGGEGPVGTVRELAARLAREGAPVGEVFAFISGLYFRGKLTYARAFTASALVITPSRGLLGPDTLITLEQLEEFAATSVDPENALYRAPLERDLVRLIVSPGSEAPNAAGARGASDAAAGAAGAHTAKQTRPRTNPVEPLSGAPAEVVLFGSIATGKYVDVLLPHLADRLMLPEAFIGRGDMSRGGLMLRAAAAREELHYIPVAGAIRRGSRPPKLTPQQRARTTTMPAASDTTASDTIDSNTADSNSVGHDDEPR